MSTRPVSLTKKLASATNQTEAVAAETVDKVVHEILRKLKSGHSASLPGLGVLRPGKPLPASFVPARPAKKGS
jgi:nucleoid DNA-binding protein